MTKKLNKTYKPNYDELEAMYAGQCQLTDEYAEKLKEKSDASLLEKIKELEEQIATLNKNITRANLYFLEGSPALINTPYERIESSKRPRE